MNDVSGWPVVVNEKMVQGELEDHISDRGFYADVYRAMVDLFNRSPTMAVGVVRGVPTISLYEMVTAIKRKLPELQEFVSESKVRQLATLFSLKTGAIITQQFMEVTPELPLLLFVLEEEGCFE